ncbi:hypothetical protein BASA60_001639 [Batrachochytrium salamandrivorans]|nr:hypothetical protein BASA60_001639 [Batrachochytrium salamandrivorans]
MYRKKRIEPIEAEYSVNSTSTTPLAEALLESTLTSGFFTLRRKGRKPASDLEHESGEHSSPKDLAKSMLTIQTNSGHLDDELDLVHFLMALKKSWYESAPIMTVESVIGNRQSTLSSRSQTSTTHPDTTHQNTRPKSGLSVNLVSDSDVRQYCTLGVSTDGLHRDNSSIDIASASSSTTPQATNVDTSLSSKPAVEIRLENCVAMPVRSTTENVFEITYPDGKLRCYPQTYASMVDQCTTYEQLCMTDEAAAALGVEVSNINGLLWIKSIWSPDFVYPDVRESLERFVVAIQGSFGPLPSV